MLRFRQNLLAISVLSLAPFTSAFANTERHASVQDCEAVLASGGATRLANRYEVRRNGSRIGSHVIEFEQLGGALRVVSTTRMRVSLFFVTAFAYDYRSEELWCDGTLQHVETSVRENRTRHTTSALRVGPNAMMLSGPDGEQVVRGEFFTTNHWNVGATETDTLFNTITGTMNDVRVAPIVSEGDVIRYGVRGALDIDTFYDGGGDWHGMVFAHSDGSEVAFDCVTCDATPSLALRRSARRYAASQTGSE